MHGQEEHLRVTVGEGVINLSGWFFLLEFILK